MAVQALPRTTPRARRRFSPAPYLFLAPALISIALLTAFPLIYTVIIAFTNYNLRHSTPYNPATFVGLNNFINILSPGGLYSQLFVPIFLWTVFFAVSTSILNYAVGLLMAILLNNPRLPERAFYRTLLIVPWALPSVITVLIWSGMLNESFGAVDAAITSICVPGTRACLPAIPWLSDPTGARGAILLVNLWMGFPFQMIVCLGGLQSIPSDVYEAASVDGATAWQRLRSITIPLVFRVTLPAVIFAFSFNMTNFNVIYLLTQGNPARSDNLNYGQTDVLLSFIYKVTQAYQYNLGAALAIVLFIITAVLSVVGFRITGAFKEIEA